jgi:carbonic anhydrase/acetyltransferase-like protein (isoleucine patch superfamily)
MTVHDTVFVAPGAHLIGRVSIGEGSSVWFNSVLRADINRISIGRYTNVQDLSVVHVTDDDAVQIGDYVTAGHGVTLHGCTVANGCLIGMGAILLSGCQVGEGVIIGAGALVPEKAVLEPGHLYLGMPCKKIRPIRDEERASIQRSAERYAVLAERYRKGEAFA